MAVIQIKFCDVCTTENPDNLTIDQTVEEVTIGWESTEQRKVFACEKHREPLQGLYELGATVARRGRKPSAAGTAAGTPRTRKTAASGRRGRAVPLADVEKSKTGAGAKP